MRIAFWGNFGTLNLGNEATLAAALAGIRERIADAQLLAICRDPADVSRRHGVEAAAISCRIDDDSKRWPKPFRVLQLMFLEVFEWHRAFKVARGLDALLVPGCGILCDKEEGRLGLPYELFKWSVVTRLRGAKLCYVSVGAESISRTSTRWLIRWVLRLAHYRSYRDTSATALLAQCGVDTTRDAIRPDLAFSLPVEEHRPTGESTQPDRPRAARVAIGVYNFRGQGRASSQDAEQYRAYLDKLCTLIERLSKRGHPLRVILGDARYDRGVVIDLRAELKRRDLPCCDVDFDDTPADSHQMVMRQLQGVDFVIASRFHNLVLGMLLGKPIIAVAYEAKHESLMTALGANEYFQKLEQLDVDRLIAQFEQLQLQQHTARAQIAQHVRISRHSLNAQFEELADLIGRPGPLEQAPDPAVDDIESAGA